MSRVLCVVGVMGVARAKILGRVKLVKLIKLAKQSRALCLGYIVYCWCTGCNKGEYLRAC